jgi:ribosome-binding factor A
MSTDRLTRVNELMRREIGEALYRVLQDYEVDMSAITVTHVSTSSNLRSAHVFISIREHVGDRRRMMRQISRHAKDIQRMINSDLNLKYTPRLTFDLNPGIEKGDQVLHILHEMDPGDESEFLDATDTDTDDNDDITEVTS